MKAFIVAIILSTAPVSFAETGVNVFGGAPSAEFGAAIFKMKDAAIRPYADVRMSVPFTREGGKIKEKLALNGGANFCINPNASIYAAVGLEYSKSAGEADLKPNVIFGISLLRTQSIGFNIGWSQLHQSFNVGATFIF